MRGESWLVACRISLRETGLLQLGDEGSALWMMQIDTYLESREAIPQHQDRLQICLAEFD